MKKVKQLLVALCVAAGFMACSDDETGLAPVFNNSDVNLEMRRDTADTYQISLPITSEEGLAKIALVNTTTNETIDEVTSFTDPLNYTYNYTLDLTAYTESTVLMMNLNITDLAGQTVTKKITLTINFPVIGVRFVGENLQSQFEDYNLKVAIDKGVTDLKQVDVYLGEELAESLTLDPALESQEVNVHIGGLAMGENNVRLVVIDEFDQEFTAETIVTRIEQVGFLDLAGVNFTTGNVMEMFGYEIPESIGIEFNRPDFDYPEGYTSLPYVPENPDKLYTISFCLNDMMSGPHTIVYALEYDEESGNVISLLRDTLAPNPETWNELVGSEKYEFSYNAETGNLEGVTKNGAAYITDVVCENGYILSYKIDGKEHEPIYNENNDRVDNNYFGTQYEFSDQPNPLYISGLPAVVPCYVFGTDLSMWLYNKYLPTQLGDRKYTTTEMVDYVQSVSWQVGENEAMIEYYYNEPETEVSE